MKKKASPQSPLAGIAEALQNMTPAEKAAWRKRVQEAKVEREAAQKAAEKAKNTGECVVCHGEVTSRPSWNANPALGASNHVYGGNIYCTQCGLRYAFLPKKKVKAAE